MVIARGSSPSTLPDEISGVIARYLFTLSSSEISYIPISMEGEIRELAANPGDANPIRVLSLSKHRDRQYTLIHGPWIVWI